MSNDTPRFFNGYRELRHLQLAARRRLWSDSVPITVGGDMGMAIDAEVYREREAEIKRRTLEAPDEWDGRDYNG